MNTPRNLKRIIAGGLMSGAVAVAGLGPAAGTAQADPQSQGPFQWCPGQPMAGVLSPIRWDMSVCHTYWATPFGRGNVPLRAGGPSSIWEGNDPPPYFEPVCPPFFPQPPCRPN